MGYLQQKLNSRWAIGLCILVSFVAGFGLSFLARNQTVPPAEAKTAVADFRVEVPEGETIVTITNRDADAEELGRLTIYRRGDTVVGLPRVEKRIEPRERLSAEDVAFLRHEIGDDILNTESVWQRSNKLRAWLARRYRLGFPGLSTRNPRQAYEQMKSGEPVLCGNLAQIYVALAEAAGLTARPVGLSVAVQNGLFGVDTHAGAEVWIPEMGGWIYEDPTFNCYWEVDGKPASAMVLHDAVMEQRPLEFAPHTRDTEQRLQDYYLDPRLYFRQISYEYKPGGIVLYFADKRLEPLNLRDKNWIHTDKRLDIQRLDTGGNLIVEQRSEIAPGVFVQVIGNDLFVRDRREQGPGIRVRSSSGTVEGCAYQHQRAQDLGLFNGTNLARNPAFRLSTRSNQIADEWSVAGPVQAMTVSGGQAMASLAGGKLWQRIPVRRNGRYLFYARVSVSRGFVNWSLADPERGPKSVGTIEPERISEVVSDIVESRSGYLDIGFDVPSGGAFRVLDVIVTEAPRFIPTN